ncbi:BSD domain-containing protein 1-A-like [Culicoides brevitarsis]|uniref:BSD domain-containing protein 1-A-like n=1 Tax=Culicoides brevitarsis TaxID=469753 RepID=UPI00307C5DCA
MEEEVSAAVEQTSITPADDPVPSTSSSPSTTTAKPEEASKGGSWGSWGWGLLENAKTKSFSVLEAVKADLGELSTVIKEEASVASEVLGLNQEDSTVNVMKKSISSFLGQVSDVLVPPVEDEEAEAIMITKDGSVTLTGFAKHLAELQANDATYVQEPVDELAPQYKRWLEIVEQEQFTEPRLTKQLTNSQILNEKYLSLVPDKVSHMEFWKRYLFKKALLEDAVANAEAVARKAEAEASSTKPTVPDTIIVQTEQPKAQPPLTEEEELQKWEEDICAANIELSEEEQARLLEEYEQEIKGQQNSKKQEKTSNNKKNPTKSTPANNSNASQASKSNRKSNNGNQNNKGNKQNATNANNKNQGKAQTTGKKKEVDLSSTSDESWEKDFE